MYNPKIIQNFIVIVKFFIDVPLELIIRIEDQSRDPYGRRIRTLRFTPKWNEIAARSTELSRLGIFAAISAEWHEESFFAQQMKSSRGKAVRNLSSEPFILLFT